MMAKKRLVLKKDSFVYKVAFGHDSHPPQRISRCELFWRFVFMFLAGWPGLALFALAVAILVTSIGFLFGYRPVMRGEGGQEDLMTPIKSLPRIRGRRVWPIAPLLAGLAIYYIPALLSWVNAVVSAHIAVIVVLSYIFIGLVVVVSAGYLLRRFPTSPFREGWELFRYYMEDLKDGLCPFYEIE